MDNRPIAIIDSGLGGLSIAQAIWQQLPYESTIYLADHLFFPYGNRSVTEINRRLITLFNFILGKNCKAVVIACNTITSNSIKLLRDLYTLPLIGIEPAIKPAIKANLKENIVVWATPTTIKSHSFKLLIKQLDQSGQVKGISCKNLAKDIETKSAKDLKPVLKTLISQNPKNYSALVLGCSHYILIKDQLKKLLPANIIIIEPSQAIALQTEKILSKNKILSGSHKITKEFYTTGNNNKVSKTASRLLVKRIIFKACSL